MRIEVSTSTSRNPATAISELLSNLRRGADDAALPDFVAIYGRHDVMTPGMQQAAVTAFDGRPVHAGSSFTGVISHQAHEGDAMATCGAIAFFDPEGDFGTGSADLGNNPKAAAEQATRDALEAAGRPGEAPQIVFLSSAPGSEESVLAGIRSVVGDGTMLMGGTAADDDRSGKWSQFSHKAFHTEGVVVSVLFLASPPQFGYQSGYRPVGHKGIVTEAIGRKLISIDGVSATEVYAQWTGLPTPATSGDQVTLPILAQGSLYPLGRVTSHVNSVPIHLLMLPTLFHADGSIDFLANINQGDEVFLMKSTPDNIIERVGSVGRMAFAGAENPKASLVIFCAGCMMAVASRMPEVTKTISNALGQSPFLGIFTFGEQGSVVEGQAEHGNLMISCAVFN